MNISGGDFLMKVDGNNDVVNLMNKNYFKEYSEWCCCNNILRKLCQRNQKHLIIITLPC